MHGWSIGQGRYIPADQAMAHGVMECIAKHGAAMFHGAGGCSLCGDARQHLFYLLRRQTP